MTINIDTESAKINWTQGLITSSLFLIVCLSWGTTWLGIKISIESLPPMTAAGLRFVVAFPVLLAFAFLRRESIFFPRNKQGFFIVVTLFYFTLPYYLLNFGELYVSSGLTSLLFSTMPVFIMVLSAILLKEKIYVTQLVGTIIGFGSLLMILKSQGVEIGHSSFIGIIAILTAAIMHAFCYVFTKKKGKEISVIAFNTLPIGIAGILLCLVGTIKESPNLSLVTTESWLAVLYLGIIATIGGFIAYFYLLKKLSPIALSFVFIVFPVFGVLLSSWYESIPLTKNTIMYSTFLLLGFAITKVRIEELFTRLMQRNRS